MFRRTCKSLSDNQKVTNMKFSGGGARILLVEGGDSDDRGDDYQ